MALAPGTRIGPYEVLSAVGAGAMGEVYRARDVKLNRDVALKILPPQFAADSDRLTRFIREAQTLAALNHPNIAQIHGFDDSGGVRALVMELVEGEDLSTRIARGPLSIEDSFAIAKQMADALEAAHEQGVVHRDLKPANIKVRADGTVKVLDFGLAKAIGNADASLGPGALSISPTLTSPEAMTAIGTIVGTAAYMAPEQAKGKRVDKRADIWAFGVVLCEMLTGKPLFKGETVTEVLAAVMLSEPDLASLPVRISSSVRWLIARCLEKDPKLRLRDIGEARLVLSTPVRDAPATPDVQRLPGSARIVGMYPWLLAALALAVALLAGLWWRATAIVLDSVIARYDVRPVEKTTLALVTRPSVALSPDGSTLAFVASSDGVTRVFVRNRDEIDPRPVPGTDGGSNPIFSPDGTEVAFFAGGRLMKARLDGAVTELAKADNDLDPRGAAWLPDGTIVYSPGAASPLMLVSASGGDSRKLTTVEEAKGERTHRWPAELPGGRAVLFTVGTLASPDNYDGAQIDAVIVATGERRRVLDRASSARYAPSGHLLFTRGAALYAVPFDADRLEIRGAPMLVVQGVNGDNTTGAAHLAIAGDGTLAYVPGNAQTGSTRLMWVDRGGNAQPLNLPVGNYFDPRISPDGTRVAVVWKSLTAASTDVWVGDFGRQTFTRLSFSEGGQQSASPVWSADGKTIYYISIDRSGRRSAIMRKPADGSRDAEEVVVLDTRAYLNAISADGRFGLVDYRRLVSGGARTDVMRVALVKGAKPEPLVSGPTDEYDGAWSPDARWLAYQSDETGRYEVYVRDTSGAGARWQVSATGGEEPHWSSDGLELFYRNDTTLMAVSSEARSTFQPKAPTVLFNGVYNLRSDTGISFDVDPKGGRFLMIRLADDSATPSTVRVVLNWFEELKRLAPTN